jgi:hypothetical protein
LGITSGFVEQADGAGILVGQHCRVTIDGCRVHHNVADYFVFGERYGIGSGGGIASGRGSYLTIPGRRLTTTARRAPAVASRSRRAGPTTPP